MDKRTFRDNVKEATSPTWKVNVAFMAEWFAWTLKRLEAEGAQSKVITHPGKKGERCEDTLREVLRAMTPSSISLASGFLATWMGTVSKEQDIILSDVDKATNLRPGGRTQYLPIEACLASIEVKSEMDIRAVREAILNCISVKTLYVAEKKDLDNLENVIPYCYAIFAYRSRHSIETTAAHLNQALQDVPYHLRPNVAYVLGKGMLLPSKDEGWTVSTEALFSKNDFKPMMEMQTPPLDQWKTVYPFLWFVSVIIDFCIEQRSKRKNYSHMEYWFKSFVVQSRVHQHVQSTRESTP